MARLTRSAPRPAGHKAHLPLPMTHQTTQAQISSGIARKEHPATSGFQEPDRRCDSFNAAVIAVFARRRSFAATVRAKAFDAGGLR